NCPNSNQSSGGPSNIANGSYGANAFIIGFPSPTTHPGAPVTVTCYAGAIAQGCGIKSDSAVQDPAEKYLLMDYGCYTAYFGEVLAPYCSHYLPGAGKFQDNISYNNSMDADHKVGTSGRWPIEGDLNDWKNGRHSGGVCVGFADGHAKWQTVDEVHNAALDTAYNIINKNVANYDFAPDHWSPDFAN
ncbi:MAG TPA: hypothetical protein VGK34_04040, partial [Armatimonadota bacterium]